MILVTRLDKKEMYLNPDHIISIEETPDTVIALYNGNHFIVREHADVIINRIIAFRSRIIKRSSANSVRIRGSNQNRRNLFKRSITKQSENYNTLQVEQESSPLHYRDI